MRVILTLKKHELLVMSAPVVDHVRRQVIQEITSKSPFSVFNIVAIVAILIIGYYLYKKFTHKFKKGSIYMPDPEPVTVKKPVVVKAPPPPPPTVLEVIPEPGVKEEEEEE